MLFLVQAPRKKEYPCIGSLSAFSSLNLVLCQLFFSLHFISLLFTAGSVRVLVLATLCSVYCSLLSCPASVEKWDCGTVTPEAHKLEQNPQKRTSLNDKDQIGMNFWVLFHVNCCTNTLLCTNVNYFSGVSDFNQFVKLE